MKTAMQELVEYVEEVIGIPTPRIRAEFSNFLQKERQQIEDAFRDGVTNEIHPTIFYADSETYYNQTYNNETDKQQNNP
jgi:hypothetical protein